MSIKQVNVTFEYDTVEDTVSNVHAFVDGIEKKKKTTKKAPTTKDVVLEDEALMVREDNKLVFNNKCAQDMAIQAEDRVIIKYEKVGKERIPIIGTDLSWDQEGSGNKVTKTNTVTYRGKANTILAEYGATFKIEVYKEGLWKLISKDPVSAPKTYEEALTQAENIDIDLLTTDDDTTEIDELTFKL